MYRPTQGQITIDGIDLADLPADAWRARTSACFQDFLNIESTIQESVGAGDLPHIDDATFVHAALDRAAALDVLERVPDGLNTVVGHTLQGQELSGGQWQKLAIGRAMTRTAPLFVALDEPTSAIDPLSELELFRRYASNARSLADENGSITLLVSHRFSTVRMADLIVVLRDGAVAEVGTHDQLIAANGLYAELYELQARHYA